MNENNQIKKPDAARHTSAHNAAKARENQIKKQKKRLDYLFSFLFLGLIAVCGILFIFSPKKKESMIENRTLASFPVPTIKTLWNGEFTGKLTDYVADHFCFRESLIKLKSSTEDMRGVRVGGVRLYNAEQNGDKKENEQPAAEVLDEKMTIFLTDGIGNGASAKALTLAEPMDMIDLTDPYYMDSGKTFGIFDKDSIGAQFGDYAGMDESELVGEQRGPLFVIGDTALEIFYGSEKVSTDYAAAVNAYHNVLGSDVTVYNMVIPNHFEFGLPKKYKSSVGKEEKPFIDLIHEKLDDDVVFVDIYDTLQKHYRIGEYLYFRSDHHWTGLGAYRAYEVFCKEAGFKPIPLNKYEKRSSEGFLGTLYNSSLDKKIADHPDTVEYYVPYFEYKQVNMRTDRTTYDGKLISTYDSGKTNGYLTFMGGDIPLAAITSDVKNGRKIIVFKESYGNAFCPFLVPHYETVYVADIRSFPYNAVDFIRENGVTDVLILNNIMSANTSARVANIVNLLTK